MTDQKKKIRGKRLCRELIQRRLLAHIHERCICIYKRSVYNLDLNICKETYKRDLQKRPTKETYKRDLQKRPTKETYKRDLLALSSVPRERKKVNNQVYRPLLLVSFHVCSFFFPY